MAKGIKTGGRKKGTPNKKTRELLDLNYCPVEELLKLAKRKNITIEQAITIHKALLPYFYPQRKAIDSMINDEVEPEVFCIKGLDMDKIQRQLYEAFS